LHEIHCLRHCPLETWIYLAFDKWKKQVSPCLNSNYSWFFNNRLYLMMKIYWQKKVPSRTTEFVCYLEIY
jgi:hypothetical protein